MPVESSSSIVIPSLATGKAPAGKITTVEMLGHSGNLEFTQDDAGLHVTLPSTFPSNFAYALKITGLKLK